MLGLVIDVRSVGGFVDYSLAQHRIMKIIFSPDQRMGRIAKGFYKRENCLISGFF